MNAIENIHGVHLWRRATARYQTSILSHAGALRNNGAHENEATVNII